MTKTLVRLTLAMAAAGLLAGSAEAASLISAKKLEIKVDKSNVEGARKDLWAKFGGWCAISTWHPAVEKCEESKEGSDSFRTLTLRDGGVIKEKLLDAAAMSYKYAIISSPLPVKNYEAQFSVTPDDDDEDEINVVWSATYDAEGKPDKDARAVIDAIFKAGIDNIKSQAGVTGGKDDKK